VCVCGSGTRAHQHIGHVELTLYPSQDPLRQPLLAASQGRKLARQAIALSLQILKCMGDYPSKRTWREYAIAVIQEGIANEELRDELFCQVVKQLINNQRRHARSLAPCTRATTTSGWVFMWGSASVGARVWPH
jgi:hypothetical protein